MAAADTAGRPRVQGGATAATTERQTREQDWRDAMTAACADMLQMTIEDLRAEFEHCVRGEQRHAGGGDDGGGKSASDAAVAAPPTTSTWRAPLKRRSRPLQPQQQRPPQPSHHAALAGADELSHGMAPKSPRDLADYVIMKTLQTRDSISMRNARSWTFNLMDRTGDGHVYREEFVRYAPLVAPAADAATAELAFGVLSRAPLDEQGAAAATTAQRKSAEQGSSSGDDDGDDNGHYNNDDRHDDDDDNNRDGDKEGASPVSFNFEVWDAFLAALQRVLAKVKGDWTEAKTLLQLDPNELLVKSRTAIDHSGTFPLPGRLYLSERYLVFIAALGSSHMLLPLELVRHVSTQELSVIRRDCVEVTYEPPSRKECPADVPVFKYAPDAKERKVWFSFSEFRTSTRRDTWHAYLSEMVAAHWTSRRNGLSAPNAMRRMVPLGDVREELSAGAAAAGGGGGGTFAGPEAGKSAAQDRAAAGGIGAASSVGGGGGGGGGSGTGGASFGSTSAAAGIAGGGDSSRSVYMDAPVPVLARVARLNILRTRALKRARKGELCSDLLVFTPGWRNSVSASAASTAAATEDVATATAPAPAPAGSGGAHANDAASRDDAAAAAPPHHHHHHHRPSRLRAMQGAACAKYVACLRGIADGDRRSWLARAIQQVNVNMEERRRRNEVEREDDPLDLTVLSQNMSTFIDLLAPIGVVTGAVNYVLDWVQPVFSGIVAAALLLLVALDLVTYLVPIALLCYALIVLLIRVQLAGPGASDRAVAAVSQRTSSFSILARVHSSLRATQAWLQGANRHLGKVESLHMWRAPHMTWKYLASLLVAALLVALVPFRWLFGGVVLYVFTLHFRDPDARDFIDEFYEAIPTRDGYARAAGHGDGESGGGGGGGIAMAGTAAAGQHRRAGAQSHAAASSVASAAPPTSSPSSSTSPSSSKEKKKR